MPSLIGLNRDERLRLARIGDRTRAFVDKALAIASDNPGLTPWGSSAKSQAYGQG